MSTSPPPKKPRRRRAFTPEFKAEAVRLATQPGRSIRQVAKELDLSESCPKNRVATDRIAREG